MRRTAACVLTIAVSVMALVAWPTPGSADPANDQYVRITTTQGTLDVRLFTDVTPKTVANFLKLIDSYASTTFLHRSTTVASDGVTVLQGGQYYLDSSDNVSQRTGDATVPHETGPSNRRGTIAMARTANDPDSASSEFFFNVQDDTSLDTANGGYTVFGEVVGDAGLAVLDKLAGLEVVDLSGSLGANFKRVPVHDYTGTVSGANLVKMTSLKKITAADLAPAATPTPGPATPTPSPASTPSPTATPAPVPFVVAESAVSAPKLKRRAKSATFLLHGLPATSKVTGALKIGKLAVKARATASATGVAKLSFKLSKRARRALQHRQRVAAAITVTPPGGRASSVKVTAKVG